MSDQRHDKQSRALDLMQDAREEARRLIEDGFGIAGSKIIEAIKAAEPFVVSHVATLDLKHAESAELWVESPSDFLEGWGGKELPPTFRVYAERLYKAYKAVSERMSATRQSDFEWLATFKCNHYHLTRNDDHASNYTTAKEWIEVFSAPDFEDVDPAELQVMKDTNTIWCLHVYDQTPIGFYRWYGATLASVVKQAREHFESATSDGTAKP